MTPEEQKEFVALQDKLAATEKERDEHAAKLETLGKDIDELKKINQELFLRATTPAATPPTDGDKDDEAPSFTSDDLLKALTSKGGK